MSKGASGREWHGNYRAKVVEVDIEGNDYGAIRVFVPDLLVGEIIKYAFSGFDEDSWGLIAYPANNNMGGYNKEDKDKTAEYQASIHVPLKNSWIWVWFEGGDPARPFYGNAFMYRESKVPPENRGVSKPHQVYTLCKTHSGRSIVVCDSPDQERIEIMGKKRIITGGPEGDSFSAYGVDLPGNATTILLDERAGSEKLLIKTVKGDYIHIDIDERKLQAYFKSDIVLETDGNISLAVKGNITLKCDGNVTTELGGNGTTKIGGDSILQTGGIISSKSGGDTSIDADGGTVVVQLPSAKDAPTAVPIPPMGFRST